MVSVHTMDPAGVIMIGMIVMTIMTIAATDMWITVTEWPAVTTITRELIPIGAWAVQEDGNNLKATKSCKKNSFIDNHS